MVVPPSLRMQFRGLVDYFARCGQRRIRFGDFLMCWTLIQQGLHLLTTDLFSPLQLGDPPVLLNVGMQPFQGLLHVRVEVDDVCSLFSSSFRSCSSNLSSIFSSTRLSRRASSS